MNLLMCWGVTGYVYSHHMAYKGSLEERFDKATGGKGNSSSQSEPYGKTQKTDYHDWGRGDYEDSLSEQTWTPRGKGLSK